MMLVQMCVLIRVGIKKGHVDLHNLVYPVSGLGAARQLEHIKDPEDRRYVARGTYCEANGLGGVRY